MPQARNIYLRLLTSPFLVSLTKRTNQGPQAWKMEYIPANKVSVAWQLPQYALVTAGEVMFSVTGLEFSYSQVGLFGFFNKFIYFNWRLITLQYCIGSAIHQHESATGVYMFPILNPPPSSLPVPSLWVVSVNQPQASSIMH